MRQRESLEHRAEGTDICVPGGLLGEDRRFVKDLACPLPTELWDADLKAGSGQMEHRFRAAL